MSFHKLSSNNESNPQSIEQQKPGIQSIGVDSSKNREYKDIQIQITKLKKSIHNTKSSISNLREERYKLMNHKDIIYDDYNLKILTKEVFNEFLDLISISNHSTCNRDTLSQENIDSQTRNEVFTAIESAIGEKDTAFKEDINTQTKRITKMKSNLLKKKNDEVILKELAGTEYVIVSYIEGIDNKEEKKSLQDHITKYQKKFIDKEISYDQYLTEIYEPIRKDALSKYESATSRINELLPPGSKPEDFYEIVYNIFHKNNKDYFVTHGINNFEDLQKDKLLGGIGIDINKILEGQRLMMELKNKKVFKKTTISGSKRRDSLKDNTKADRDVMSDGSPAYMDDLDLYSHRMQGLEEIIKTLELFTNEQRELPKVINGVPKEIQTIRIETKENTKPTRFEIQILGETDEQLIRTINNGSSRTAILDAEKVLTDNTKKMYYLEYTDTVVAKAEHWAKRIQTEVERNKVVGKKIQSITIIHVSNATWSEPSCIINEDSKEPVKDDNGYSYTNAPATSEVFGRDRIQAIATYLPETYIMRQLSENDSDQPHKFRVEITYKQ